MSSLLTIFERFHSSIINLEFANVCLKLFWKLGNGLANETTLFRGGKSSHRVVSVSVHVGHQYRGTDDVERQKVGGLQNVTDGVHDKTANFSSKIKHIIFWWAFLGVWCESKIYEYLGLAGVVCC